ncbi:hypothetical protein ACFWIR_39990, partial [Streptomyces olivaceus]
MKTSWRSASLVASAAAVLALTTGCGGQDGGAAAGSQNVGATASPGDVGEIGTGADDGLGANGAQASASAPEPAGKLLSLIHKGRCRRMWGGRCRWWAG